MRIVKIGGRPQANPRLSTIIGDAWQSMPGGLCIVHGGGDEMSAMQRALGKHPEFVGGRRVTSEGDIELLRMVLSGVVNKRLVNAFLAVGLPAIGISGEDGALIGAEAIDKAKLGFAGRPVKINADLLRSLLNAGYLPVISPVAYDSSNPDGGALNVNGDDAAAAIAAALGAEELLLVSDVEGVRDADGVTFQSLSGDSARELIATGIAAGGMAAKIESAREALAGGVGSVRICDLNGLFDDQVGTFITLSQSVAI
ncbi:MAG TPA: acetylglutamate kinase [Gemmatimonadaceae bacterium]|jgi:acetylglutamate kinase|nr:acetylglutamate kinase [Gemmatimonadaceae bacterium]